MNEFLTLTTLGEFTLSAYGLILAAGALIAVLLTCMLGGKRPGVNASLSLSACVIVCAVLGARIVYCLTNLETFLVDYEEQGGAAYMLQLWQGGYSLYGAVLGGLVGVLIYAKGTGQSFALLADLAAPGAALVLCVGRAAEWFTHQGIGKDLEYEFLSFFPFAMETEEEWFVIPVFLWESFAALVILVVLLAAAKKYAGYRSELFIILLGVTQILLESLRNDDFIRFGFVRFNQLAAAVTTCAVLLLRIRRALTADASKTWQIVRSVIFAAAIGIVIAIEFALDKSSIDNLLLYCVMAVTLVGMACALLIDGKSRKTAA